MADDIQIKTSGTQNVTTSQASVATSTTAASAPKKQDGAPVIDLRNLDSGSSAPTVAPSKPKSNGIDLVEEDASPASAKKYVFPPIVTEKFPDLPQLIEKTESMNDDEREYWFQILPIMTEDQIKKFRDILVNEKDQLARLDKEYEDELTKLNEKHMIEWKEFETKEKRKALQEAEQKSAEQEKKEEEDLLKRLSQI